MHSVLPSQTSMHIEQLEALAVQSFRNHDYETITALHDNDCVGVGILGAQYRKDQFISAFRNSLTVRSIELLSTQIVLEESFAVVLSNWDVNMAFGPSVIDGRVRVTRTWVKRGADWKILSFHFSDARMATTWEKLRSPNR